MGIALNGPGGEVTGRVGKLVYYTLNGKNIVRNIGTSDKPPSLKQEINKLITKISGEFFSLLKPFINVGFAVEAIGTDKNAFNLAVKENKGKMFKGAYPDFEVDYSKLMLSQGILQPGDGLRMSVVDATIVFSWTVNPKMPWEESTDQVMMLAYFPEQRRIIYKVSGNKRDASNDALVLPPSLVGKYAETYVAFVATDRKQVSDSTYMGSINVENL